MLNFDFYNPTEISFGRGKIAELNRLVPENARVLLLFGGESARKTGTLDEVKAALAAREVHEFGGIEPNPSFETLMNAVEMVRQHQLDFLLAVGGGSVIDGTKFVAAAVHHVGDPWDILLSRGRKIQQTLPFGAVLTLPATGSEMNNGGVVTRKSLQAKLAFSHRQLFPQFSVLDPAKSFTLPARQVANGVVDAFVHTIEQYLTYPVDARVQDRFAEGLLQTLIEIGPVTLAEPENYDARANLMWVATLALNGLIGAGVPQDWATHMLGHEVTALYGLDHAQTLAVILPPMLEIRRAAKKAKLLQYAERVWGIVEGSEDARIDAAIAQTRAFFESLGVKTRLRDYNLTADVVDPLLNQLEAHSMTKLGEDQSVDLAMSRVIYSACV